MLNKIAVFCLLISVLEIRSEVSDVSRDEQNLSQGDASKSSKTADSKAELFVNETSIPAVRQGKETLRQMCIQNAGNESYDKAEEALSKMKQCFSEIIVYAELLQRVEKAKPIGEVDSVFKDYCQRTDDLKGCIVKFLADVEPCMPEKQKNSKYTIQNITDAILNFACEFEGDHIALFISERGPECILSRQHGIEECIKSRINDTGFNDTTEQSFSLDFELEQCITAYDIRKCIIRELSLCSGSTPANVIESVFNLVQNATTCSKFTPKQLDPEYSGGMPMYRSMFSVIIPAFTILLVRTLS